MTRLKMKIEFYWLMTILLVLLSSCEVNSKKGSDQMKVQTDSTRLVIVRDRNQAEFLASEFQTLKETLESDSNCSFLGIICDSVGNCFEIFTCLRCIKHANGYGGRSDWIFRTSDMLYVYTVNGYEELPVSIDSTRRIFVFKDGHKKKTVIFDARNEIMCTPFNCYQLSLNLEESKYFQMFD